MLKFSIIEMQVKMRFRRVTFGQSSSLKLKTLQSPCTSPSLCVLKPGSLWAGWTDGWNWQTMGEESGFLPLLLFARGPWHLFLTQKHFQFKSVPFIVTAQVEADIWPLCPLGLHHERHICHSSSEDIQTYVREQNLWEQIRSDRPNHTQTHETAKSWRIVLPQVSCRQQHSF